MMSNGSRQEYLSEIQERYWLAGRKEKGTILDEFSSTCRYNRKYAIRVLNILPKQRKARQKKRRGRPKHYHHEHVIQFLRDLWQATNLACSKRLKAMIPLWLPYYEQTYDFELSLEVKTSLMNISHSTIDRLLAPLRSRYQKIGLSTTKPGSLLKKHIPIRVNQWDETKPGFLEADIPLLAGLTAVRQWLACLSIRLIQLILLQGGQNKELHGEKANTVFYKQLPALSNRFRSVSVGSTLITAVSSSTGVF